MKPVRWAPSVHRKLNGVFCVYKPTGISSAVVLARLRNNLCADLNALPCYKNELMEAKEQAMSLPFASNMKEKSLALTNSEQTEDLSEHRLVLGQRYIAEDFDINYLNGLNSRVSSGVMMIGIGREGKNTLGLLSLAKFLRVYHVKGQLGYATDNGFDYGTFVQRTTYKIIYFVMWEDSDSKHFMVQAPVTLCFLRTNRDHITKAKMDKICSSAQSGHQRLMFKYAGVDPDSEEAYRLASKGIVRPQTTKTPPILYSVKCIHFEPPDFTLEIHSINEKCWYLAQLIHDIGVKLKSTAVCKHIHRIRYGHFELDHTLLPKEWNINPILKNMRLIEPLLHPRKLFTALPMNKRGSDQIYEDKEVVEDTELLIKKALKNNIDDEKI